MKKRGGFGAVVRAGVRARLVVLALVALVVSIVHGAYAAEAPRRYPPDRPFDIDRIALDLDVDLRARAISGTATIEARSVERGLSFVAFDALELEIEQVQDEEGRALSFRNTGERLEVRLGRTLVERNTPFALRIRYRARPRKGLNWFSPSATEPEVPLQVWSQNEPTDARRWFPCVDHPEERQATELRVRVPAEMTVISNGVLLEPPRPVAGERRSWHFRQSEPHPAYLVTLVVGTFHVERTRWRDVELSYFVPPDRRDDLERTFARTPAMLDFFSERFGVRYPWPVYRQVVVEQFSFGGMENTGATTLNERTLHGARAHLDTSSEPLIAHELAHQWFGDLVTCRDWAHIWLNEGAASFGEACWDEHANGRDAYDWNMLNKAHGAIRGGRDTPIVRARYRDPSETFFGPTYPKGAWVFHMLRRRLGELDFWEGIRRYLERYRGRAVETDDLRRVLEEVSGKSLGRFFDQWLRRAGHPKLEVRGRWRARKRRFELELVQKQGGEPFHFRFDVALTLEGGERRVWPIEVKDKETAFTVELEQKPLAVGLDPELRVLAEIEARIDRDLVLSTLRHAPRAVSRIRAADALRASRGDRPVREALAAAIERDRALGVRLRSVEVLASFGGEQVRDALLGLLERFGAEAGETKAGGDRALALRAQRDAAIVRRKLVAALSAWRHEAPVRKALRRIARGLGEPSEKVQAKALRVLAGEPEAEDEAVFAAALEKRSHNEQLALAAIEGLAALPDAAGLERLLELARPLEAPAPLRAAALRALGRVAASRAVLPARREAVIERLGATLEEASFRFRRAALEGLGALGAEAMPLVGVIEALAAKQSDEGLRAAARSALEAIHKGAPSDQELARLRKRLAEIDERERTWSRRLEALERRVEAVESERKFERTLAK